MQLNPNLTLVKATNLVRQQETVKQQQTILDGGFKLSRVKVDGAAKGNYGRKKDSLKDKSQEKTKAMLPEKCLAIFIRRKVAQHLSPSVGSA